MRVMETQHPVSHNEFRGSDYVDIVERLLRKRDLLRAGDTGHERIRTALFIDGGGMRGVYGGGVIVALEQLGLTDVFDYVIGVSAGAADCAYFLSGQAEFGTSLYYEELASKRFINVWRFSKILDIDYLDESFRYTKPLDSERVRQSRSRFLIGVTKAETGECVYLDMADSSIDVITAIRASTALPIVYNRTVSINGEAYSDGTTGCGVPVDYITSVLGCNTVLFILNRIFSDKNPRASWYERLLTHAVSRNYSPSFRYAYLNRKVPYNASLSMIRGADRADSDIVMKTISPAIMPISNLCIDGKKLKAVAQQATEQTMRIFANRSVDSATSAMPGR
jgi:predicted patatin/cPLA2 family phospholipase